MASLAPGNGWFPRRAYSSLRNGESVERRRPLNGASNVYSFPGTPNTPAAASRWHAARGSAVATRVAAVLLADSIRAGRTARWMLGWGLFGLVAASLAWLGFAGVLVAAALLYGVPWATVAVAATLIHALAATLAVLMGLRIGRRILHSAERRNQLARRAA